MIGKQIDDWGIAFKRAVKMSCSVFNLFNITTGETNDNYYKN